MKLDEIIHKVIHEEINRIKEALYEAEQIVCNGKEEWPDAKECITDFICNVLMFNNGFINLQNRCNKEKERDFSNLAKKLFDVIGEANRCIFKENRYGFQRSVLKPYYKKPISLMYDVKTAMGTSLLSFIMERRSQFRMIQSRLRSDELDRRIIDIMYGGKEIDYYHIPEKLQDLLPLCTNVSDGFKMRPEDSALPDGTSNPNYRKDCDTYPSGITNEYLKPLGYLKDFLKSMSNQTDTKIARQRQKAAEDGIKKGFIIPVFGNTELPCLVKQKVKGQEAYNAIPNALANTKNDYMLRNEETGETVWFANYEVNGDTIEFENSINFEGYMAYVYKNGEKECRSVVEEKLKRIIKNILNEMSYGL